MLPRCINQITGPAKEFCQNSSSARCMGHCSSGKHGELVQCCCRSHRGSANESTAAGRFAEVVKSIILTTSATFLFWGHGPFLCCQTLCARHVLIARAWFYGVSFASAWGKSCKWERRAWRRASCIDRTAPSGLTEPHVAQRRCVKSR